MAGGGGALNIQAPSDGGWVQSRIQVWKTWFQDLGLLWHESGQDFLFFCYRIGYGALTAAQSRALELAPVSLGAVKTSFRKIDACSKPSFIFSARSTTPKA